MTTRLKRKLGELGIDPSSARANESFCLIGTPLPPLEKSKDTGEFVPLWKQDVRDEKGRRRLHGAFTGGFSAGYFNSVGSKEGWTPSNFVSSRGDRAKHKAARPEDFMDEEDLQELKDGKNLVDTTEQMDLGDTKAELKGRGRTEEAEDSIASILETSMLPAPQDSAGARILKKMGWRLGQGIGPRVTFRQRKMQDLQATSGENSIGNVIDIPDDDEEANKHTYAPRDTPVLQVERKDNYHGLGYHPGMGLHESLGAKGHVAPAGPKVSAGFGLGALNDADEDDLDVYDGGAHHSRSRTAYDIIDREEDDKISIGGKSETSRRKTVVRSASSVERFRDGQPVLPDFVLSDKPVAEDRWFPLPDVPKGWQPDPRRVWDKDKENIRTAEVSSQPTAHGKWKAGISADEVRGAILGETPLPSAPRSVFEYMSQKDRERLKTITSGGTLPSPGHPSHSTPAPAPAILTIPRTEPHIAQAALRGFQPFTADPERQSRYMAYLQAQASPSDAVSVLKPLPGQKIEEFNKELEGYAKAALLFKPISGAMAGRFTSASVVDHGPKIHEGLHTPSAEDLAEKEAKEQKEAEERISPKAHAARMGMYGPLTREVKPWQPARLLCKRFGVKDPNPIPEASADVAATAGDTTATSAASQRPEFPATDIGSGLPARNRRDPSNIGLGEDDDQGRDTLTYQRPKMDIFKAIFASDDEDSDDDAMVGDDEDGKHDEPPSISQVTPKELLPDLPAPIEVSGSGAVDISTFKPTFIPRDGKPKKLKEKKEKKKKEKRSILVSFEMDEDGVEQPPPKSTKDRPKKRRKEMREEEDDEMWVEKPPPNVVMQMLPARPPEYPSTETVGNASNTVAGTPKGRKRAVDFM